MNSLGLMISIGNVVRLAILIFVGGLAWFAADMRSILRSKQLRHQLVLEGRWAEVEQYWRQVSRTYRPFVWLFQRWLMPGGNAVQFGLFLFQRGRLEEALTMVDQAIKQIENKPAFLRPVFRSVTRGTLAGALSARALILTGMGRYQEAREAAARLGQVSGSNVRPNSHLTLLELRCGHLDEALALAKTVPPQDSQYDSTRSLASWAYRLKGEFAKAIESLEYEPSAIAKFYRAEDLKDMNRSAEGSKLLELQERNLAGISNPVRWLSLSSVYLDQEAFKSAGATLDEAEKSLGSNSALQIIYWSQRARSHAGQGRSAEADACIARVRAMLQQLPRRSTAMETHLAIGRSYLSLRRFPEALVELAEAERNALHPIEKHEVAYWIARTHEAAGNTSEAMTFYRKVVADSIASRMRRYAEEALHKPTTT